MQRNPLYKDLTIIITTSPIKSHPSTNLLDETIESFLKVDGLNDCNKIIICDGYVNNEKDKFKSGHVTSKTIIDYEKFIELIVEKVNNGTYKYTTINKQATRNGFAKNVQIVLDLVVTPYVIVIQHDQVFARNVNLASIINSMNTNLNINYVGMLSRSDSDEIGTKLMHPSFKNFINDIQTEINTDIQFEWYKYKQLVFENNNGEEKRIDLLSLRNNNKTKLILDYHKIKYGLPLMFLVFWYDKTHICRTEFYKKFIFNNIHTNYKAGKSMRVSNFIEDSVGNIQMENIKYNGLCAFKNYGSYILYDDITPAIYHSNGRKYIPKDEIEKITGKKDQSGGNTYYEKYLKYGNKISKLLEQQVG